MGGLTGLRGLILEIHGVRLDANALTHLFELLEDSVVVRPNGETFQIVRDLDSLRYVTVDADALGDMAIVRRSVGRACASAAADL